MPLSKQEKSRLTAKSKISHSGKASAKRSARNQYIFKLRREEKAAAAKKTTSFKDAFAAARNPGPGKTRKKTFTWNGKSYTTRHEGEGKVFSGGKWTKGAAEKPAAKKPAAKKLAVKKPAAKKPADKKPARKQPAMISPKGRGRVKPGERPAKSFREIFGLTGPDRSTKKRKRTGPRSKAGGPAERIKEALTTPGTKRIRRGKQGFRRP